MTSTQEGLPADEYAYRLEVEGPEQSSSSTSSKLNQSTISAAWNNLSSVSSGGTVFDGFLLAASSEVGQSILTLPNIFSQVGFSWGLVLEAGFATMALYTNFLLVSMHAQHRHNLKASDDPKHSDPYHIVSYHEIMDALVGPWLKQISIVVVFFALLGLSTVQIIATASNCYILDDSRSKRSWALLWGFLFSFISFVPNFRHYRMLSILGIMTTTYTAWYMVFSSLADEVEEDVVYDAPESLEGFFTGFVQLLFIFGGHTSNIEVADVMDDPASYDRSYFWSFCYVFTLTMPNAVAAYYTYGQQCSYNTNAFSLFPASPYRDFGIIMMSLHQAVAFGLFAGPLFHMWEKLIRIQDKPFKIRVMARLPLCWFMLLLAIAFPFFGAINAMLGAFTTSFGTFIIPAIGYNLAFHSEENMVKKPFMRLDWMKRINWGVALFVVFAGVGAGGFTSIKNFFEQLEHFDYFAECYQC